MLLMKDLQSKSIDELWKLIDDLKAELFMLRFKNSTGQLKEVHKIELTKKDIARVFTVISSKNLVAAKEKVSQKSTTKPQTSVSKISKILKRKPKEQKEKPTEVKA